MGEIGGSCRILFLTGFISSWISSRHIASSQSKRKFDIYFTSLRGM